MLDTTVKKKWTACLATAVMATGAPPKERGSHFAYAIFSLSVV